MAKSIEITVLEIGLFGLKARICCNLSPVQMFFHRKEVEKKLASMVTTYGFFCWSVYLGRDEKDRPMRCEKHKGRWHYIVYS